MSRRLIAIALLMLSLRPAGAAQLAGQTYDSLAQLPDFGGWWEPQLAPWQGEPPPLKPVGRTDFERIKKVFLSGGDTNLAAGTGPNGYCKPYRFIGLLIPEPEGYWEILLSPGRVTITSEAGWIRASSRTGVRYRPTPTSPIWALRSPTGKDARW